MIPILLLVVGSLVIDFNLLFLVLFAFVGLYVDIQYLRGHWKIWLFLLNRYMWLGIAGITLSSVSLITYIFRQYFHGGNFYNFVIIIIQI